MKQFLTFTDSELEFLKILGFTYNGHTFVEDNKNIYKCVGAYSDNLKEYKSISGYYTYIFKGRNGSITFIRPCNEHMPSVIVKLKNLTFTYNDFTCGERDLYPNIDNETLDNMANVLDEIKNITIPTNGSFLLSEKQTQKMHQYISFFD